MSELATTNQGGLISLLHHGGWGSLPRPFGQNIYLLETHIAGTTHVGNIKEIEPELLAGARFDFFREPNNPYDTLAIVIKDSQGRKLGYVPRQNNEILAHLMEAGKKIYGTLHEKEYVDSWLKITIHIYMEDL